MLLNLDTHVLIHALVGDVKPRERRILAASTWTISAIVLWEIAKLAELGRIELDPDDRQIARTLRSIRLWPIDWAVAQTSTRLDFRGDPADQLIAATSVVHDVPLLTRDNRIRRSKLVPLAKG